VTALAVITAMLFTGFCAYVIIGVLADRAAEAEWWHIELAWREHGRAQLEPRSHRRE
jgi:hypothetical protein